ncbi:uncharacterized protein IL334_007019 [Kwoniella shivajii]|uniref:Uncharacterized protein n=1 Tax=Kwoniella shivajii TaxID=564305 RepID=A0ABZ1DAN4_9TREE|nr:hypothetical protein IL334_007019 [Kwoniella shivajii]
MNILDLPTKSVVLAEILERTDSSRTDIEGCLAEFVIRAWKQGGQVREWCKDVQTILGVISISTILRETITSHPLQILLPFVHIPPNPYFPTVEPPLPPPLIPTSLLSTLDRQSFISALCRLSIDNHENGSRPFCDEPLILELCLSYVASMWRRAPKLQVDREDSLIDWMSKDLTEIEFELQLQGHPLNIGSTIIPILHKFRFQLGFVTCSQLITKFNSFSQPSLLLTSDPTGTSSSFSCSTTSVSPGISQHDVERFTRAWIERRLSIGIGYQSIVEELYNAKLRLEDNDYKDTIDQVLESFGIHGKNDEPSHEQFGLLWSSPSSPTSASYSTDHIEATSRQSEGLYSQLSLPSSLSLLTLKMGRRRSLSNHTPKWFSHRRNNSSSSSQFAFPQFQRAPGPPSGLFNNNASLDGSQPSITSPSISSFTFPENSREELRQSVVSQRPRTTFRDDLTSSVMSLTDPEDVRTVLLNQLMEMRYHIHGHEDEGWYLGGGREQAEELLSHLETKMIGKKDLMGLKEVFQSMRSAFDLPPFMRNDPSRPETMISSIRRDTLTDASTIMRESIDLDRFLEEVAQLPDTLQQQDVKEIYNDRHQGKQGDGIQQEEREVGKRFNGNESDDNLSRHSGRRKSASAYSALTMASLLTTDSQLEEPRMTSFEIQEAHREFHKKSRAVEYHFPLPPTTPPQSTWNSYEYTPSPVSENRDHDNRYTRLPPKVSIGNLKKTRSRTSPSPSHRKSTSESRGRSAEHFTPTQNRLIWNEDETTKIFRYHNEGVSSTETLSPLYAISPSATGNSPSRSSFETHIVTPVATRHPQPLSTLSSQATLYSPHDAHLITPDRRRASLGPLAKSRRQLHRHFAILDGEQVSPSKEMRELVPEMEAPVTPTMKILALSDGYSSDSHSISHKKLESRSRCSSFRSSITPKMPPRISSLRSLPKVSFHDVITNGSTKSPAGRPPPMSPLVSPVPLIAVLELFKRKNDNGMTILEVEDSLYRVVDIERDRVRKAGETWDEDARSKVKWLIEQIAIMLGDPIYVAPISRVVASLSGPSSSTQTRQNSKKLPKSNQNQGDVKRPLLPRYKSQPQLPTSTSTSIVSSPPRPASIRPNVLRRHTQSCMSINSIESASSIYSTPSVNMEVEEMIDIDISPSSIEGIFGDRTSMKSDGSVAHIGYQDWDIALPQMMEWPIPRIRRCSETSVGSTGTFGRIG